MTPDPTPQPAHDHGAAGFCTDHAQPERTETVARVAAQQDAWDDWEHMNWSDDIDMSWPQSAFDAGWDAAVAALDPEEPR